VIDHNMRADIRIHHKHLKIILTSNIYRKDRSTGRGGVFLGIKNTLVCVEEPNLDTTAELIRAKISFQPFIFVHTIDHHIRHTVNPRTQ